MGRSKLITASERRRIQDACCVGRDITASDERGSARIRDLAALPQHIAVTLSLTDRRSEVFGGEAQPRRNSWWAIDGKAKPFRSVLRHSRECEQRCPRL